MPEWDADLGWEDALETFSGAPGGSRLVSKIMGTSESGVAAPGWQVNTLYDDPTAQAAQDEIAMQQAIASGRTMDPATRRMQEQFALAGNQAYGAAMAAPLKNAATRGRFARGGQRAISQYAPETLAAQGLMGQEQAQQALMGVLGGRQSLMQQELERSKGAGVGQKMLEEEALGAARAAASGGISSAIGTFLPLLKDGGVVPGDKDEAVPIIAHGGEVVLSEDVSKKLLKALVGSAGSKAKKEKRLMTGDEMKAEADLLSRIPSYSYRSRGPHEPWYSEFNPFPKGTVSHDAYIRGDLVGHRGDYRGSEKPVRAQEWGPWEKGRPFEGGYKEGTGPIHPEDTGPWPYYGRVHPGEGYTDPGGTNIWQPAGTGIVDPEAKVFGDRPPPRPMHYGGGHYSKRGAWIERPEPISSQMTEREADEILREADERLEGRK